MGLPVGFEGFGFDNTFVKDTEPNASKILRELDRNDLFKVGKKSPIFRVIGKQGAYKGQWVKVVVKDKTKGRKYYIVDVVDPDTFDVGVFQGIGGTLDHTDVSIVEPGSVILVSKYGNVKENKDNSVSKLENEISELEKRLEVETSKFQIKIINSKLDRLRKQLQLLYKNLDYSKQKESDYNRAIENAKLLISLIKKHNGPKWLNLWTKYGVRIYWPRNLGYIIVSWDGTLDTTQFYYSSLFPNWKKAWRLAKDEYIKTLKDNLNNMIEIVVNGKNPNLVIKEWIKNE